MVEGKSSYKSPRNQLIMRHGERRDAVDEEGDFREKGNCS